MAFAFREALATAKRLAVDTHLRHEIDSFLTLFLLNYGKDYLAMVLLRPLYYATFKVLVVADYRVYVIEFRKDSFEEETAAIFIPFVYIYCSDKSFQSIAVDVAIVMIVGTAGTHNAVEPYFNRKLVQAFATNKIAARFGEKALALLAEIGVEEIGSD